MKIPIRPTRLSFSLMLRTALSTAVVLTPALALTGCATNHQAPVQAGEQNIQEAYTQFKLAEDATADGKIDRAIELYAQSVKAYNQYAPAWYNMGVLLMRKQRHMEAAEALQLAANADPVDPRPYTALGIQAQDLQILDRAATFYDQALERDPNYLPALKKAVEIDQLRDDYTDKTLTRTRKALYLEKDPQWIDFLKVVQAKAQERIARSGGTAGR
jgi:protein O-GlcNAc transferase